MNEASVSLTKREIYALGRTIKEMLEVWEEFDEEDWPERMPVDRAKLRVVQEKIHDALPELQKRITEQRKRTAEIRRLEKGGHRQD